MEVTETPPMSAQDLGPCIWDRIFSQFSYNQYSQLLVNELMNLFYKLSVKYIWGKHHSPVTVCRQEKEEISQIISTKLQIKNEFRRALQMTSLHK